MQRPTKYLSLLGAATLLIFTQFQCEDDYCYTENEVSTPLLVSVSPEQTTYQVGIPFGYRGKLPKRM